MNNIISTEELYAWINEWIKDEKRLLTLGVLCTVSENMPHSRTVAIREINDKGLLFFTQKGSEKVNHISNNNNVSITISLANTLRQITFVGKAESISNNENNLYWKSYPKDSQIRFLVYGPKSGEAIEDNSFLDVELIKKQKELSDKELTMPESYVGYRVLPSTIGLYQLNSEKISDSFTAELNHEEWLLSRRVP